MAASILTQIEINLMRTDLKWLMDSIWLATICVCSDFKNGWKDATRMKERKWTLAISPGRMGKSEIKEVVGGVGGVGGVASVAVPGADGSANRWRATWLLLLQYWIMAAEGRHPPASARIRFQSIVIWTAIWIAINLIGADGSHRETLDMMHY